MLDVKVIQWPFVVGVLLAKLLIMLCVTAITFLAPHRDCTRRERFIDAGLRSKHCPSPLLMHSVCMQHQVIRCALAAPAVEHDRLPVTRSQLY
jgi:hypothetical protein